MGITATPSGNGYWLVGRSGHVFSFGDTRYYGSRRKQRVPMPVVGMTRTSTGRGYWLVGQYGNIYCFGDARSFGSSVSLRSLPHPIKAVVASRHT